MSRGFRPAQRFPDIVLARARAAPVGRSSNGGDAGAQARRAVRGGAVARQPSARPGIVQRFRNARELKLGFRHPPVDRNLLLPRRPSEAPATCAPAAPRRRCSPPAAHPRLDRDICRNTQMKGNSTSEIRPTVQRAPSDRRWRSGIVRRYAGVEQAVGLGRDAVTESSRCLQLRRALR
jgi:hypothetical protein